VVGELASRVTKQWKAVVIKFQKDLQEKKNKDTKRKLYEDQRRKMKDEREKELKCSRSMVGKLWCPYCAEVCTPRGLQTHIDSAREAGCSKHQGLLSYHKKRNKQWHRAEGCGVERYT